MRVLLFILCALAFLFGGLILVAAESAIHEIESFMLFLIGAVLLVGAAVLDAINVAQKKIESSLGSLAKFSTRADIADIGRGASTASPNPGPPELAPPIDSINSTWSAAADAEARAGEMFDEARQMATSGQREKAVEMLRTVVAHFPATTASDKARRSLAKAGVRW